MPSFINYQHACGRTCHTTHNKREFMLISAYTYVYTCQLTKVKPLQQKHTCIHTTTDIYSDMCVCKSVYCADNKCASTDANMKFIPQHIAYTRTHTFIFMYTYMLYCSWVYVQSNIGLCPAVYIANINFDVACHNCCCCCLWFCLLSAFLLLLFTFAVISERNNSYKSPQPPIAAPRVFALQFIGANLT